MRLWAKLSYKKSKTNEDIFLHALKGNQFDFGPLGFSDKTQRILYIGVLNRNPGCIENPEYELILGNMSGSGAFSFPNPKLIFPYAKISETIEDSMAADAGKKSDFNAGDCILDLIYSDRSLSQEIGSESNWLELGRHLRPYDGMFRLGHCAPFVKARHAQIFGLRKIIGSFSYDLLDPKLPEGFRTGVEYMISVNAATACNRYGIPTLIR